MTTASSATSTAESTASSRTATPRGNQGGVTTGDAAESPATAALSAPKPRKWSRNKIQTAVQQHLATVEKLREEQREAARGVEDERKKLEASKTRLQHLDDDEERATAAQLVAQREALLAAEEAWAEQVAIEADSLEETRVTAMASHGDTRCFEPLFQRGSLAWKAILLIDWAV